MSDQDETVFERAIDAAVDAFMKVVGEHFGRTFDGSPEDQARLLAEYQASRDLLGGGGCGTRLRTGLIDADFFCWHSALADDNFAEESRT